MTGDSCPPSFAALLPRQVAVQSVGKAIFGAEWIGQLTERQRWLLRRYVDGEVPLQPRSQKSILVGELVFVDATTGRPWLEPVLRDEVTRAQDRREWQRDQYTRVDAWLRRHRFGNKKLLDRAAFEHAMANDFGAPTTGSARSKRKKPTDADLDSWMSQNVKRGTKRANAIGACHHQTGATFREAAAAYTRLPDDVKLKRGQRAGLLKLEQ